MQLQQTINFVFFILIYVPFNVVFVLVTALLLRFLNRILHLHFPVWVLGLAAGLFVMAVMYAWLDSTSRKDGWINFQQDDSWFLYATLIINTVVILIVFGLVSFTGLIIRSVPAESFIFGRPQQIASGVYVAMLLLVGLQPLFAEGNDYLTDVRADAYRQKIKKLIDANDGQAFAKELDEVPGIWEVQLPGDDRDLIDYLIAENKPELVGIALRKKKSLLDATYRWDVKSVEMVDTLIRNGLNPNDLIQILTRNDQRDLVKTAVDQYHPTFDSEVVFITMNVVEKNDAGVMDYLIANGLTRHVDQTNEALVFFAQKDNLEAVQVLVNRGFAVDPKDPRAVAYAIQNNNLPLLKFLFQFPYDVNQRNDEYTHLENAISSGNSELVDFLLTQKPDVQTIHYTQLNGNTNALLMAERYKHPEMLTKINTYLKN
jgi:hypothetical protein